MALRWSEIDSPEEAKTRLTKLQEDVRRHTFATIVIVFVAFVLIFLLRSYLK